MRALRVLRRAAVCGGGRGGGRYGRAEVGARRASLACVGVCGVRAARRVVRGCLDVRDVHDSPVTEFEPTPHFALGYLLRAMYLRRKACGGSYIVSGPAAICR